MPVVLCDPCLDQDMFGRLEMFRCWCPVLRPMLVGPADVLRWCVWDGDPVRGAHIGFDVLP